MREEIAAVQHEIWAHWMKYMFSILPLHLRYGTVLIPVDKVNRWKKQMNTPYNELSEKEKESDRSQADKILKCIDQNSIPF